MSLMMIGYIIAILVSAKDYNFKTNKITQKINHSLSEYETSVVFQHLSSTSRLVNVKNEDVGLQTACFDCQNICIFNYTY